MGRTQCQTQRKLCIECEGDLKKLPTNTPVDTPVHL